MPGGLSGSALINVFLLIFLFGYLAQSWNILGGFAGQLSLGHAAFFGIGAYTSTMLFTELGISPWIGMLAGMATAGAFGLFIGVVSFHYRLAGPFFTLATIAFAELTRLTALHLKITGGSMGILIPLQGDSFWHFQFSGKAPYYYIALAMMVAVTALIWWMSRSQIGYYLHAIRQDEDAAEAIGIDTRRYKLIAVDVERRADRSRRYLLRPIHAVHRSGRYPLGRPVGRDHPAGDHRRIDDRARPGDRLLHPDAGGRSDARAVFRRRIGRGRGQAVCIGCDARSKIERLFCVSVIRRRRRRRLDAVRRHPDLHLPRHAERRGSLVPREVQSMTRLLEASGVTVRFGGLVAVNGVDFHVDKDEIVGLIGPNGAGKTTFFNAISGFRNPDAGAVTFEGVSILEICRPHKISRMGMSRTFQIVKPFPEMSVLDNVMMGAFSAHRGAEGCPQGGDEGARDSSSSTHWAHRRAGDLPIAGRKRLEVAKVMACNPEAHPARRGHGRPDAVGAQRDDRGGQEHPDIRRHRRDHRACDAGHHEPVRSHLCAASRRADLRGTARQGHPRPGGGARLSRRRVRVMSAILEIRSLERRV